MDDEDLEYERRRRADTESKLRELDAKSALRLKELRSATAEKLKASMIEHAGEWFWVLILIGICVIFVVWSIAVPNSVVRGKSSFLGLKAGEVQSVTIDGSTAYAGHLYKPDVRVIITHKT